MLGECSKASEIGEMRVESRKDMCQKYKVCGEDGNAGFAAQANVDWMRYTPEVLKGARDFPLVKFILA